MKKILLYWNTLRYLRFVQIFYRLYYKFKIIRVEPFGDVDNKTITGDWTKVYYHNKTLQSNNGVLLIGQKGSINDWSNDTRDILWLYNLHYLDYINGPECLEQNDFLLTIIYDWIDKNKQGQKIGWCPYPLSLRIVNLVKYTLNNNIFNTRIKNSIGEQANYLLMTIEFHLYGNHLFSNAKALLFAGSFLNCSDSEKWLQVGYKILNKELDEQILADGGNFELSPMYHSIMLQDLLDLINLSKAFNNIYINKIEDKLVNKAYLMFKWFLLMSHPDGEISFFNDSAFEIAATFQQLKCYAEKLGMMIPEQKDEGISHLKESGYAIFKSKDIYMIADIGLIGPDYLPGHGHADILSFELSIGEERVFVNSGTSIYGESTERLEQRKTTAHNTINIDGSDSSEVWGGFRVARRAYPKDVIITKDIISASHTGFKRLKNKNIHNREWYCESNTIKISDMISGKFTTAYFNLHLHPDISLESKSQKRVVLKTPRGKKISLDIDGGELEFSKNYWHPKFALNIPNNLLKIKVLSNNLITTVNIL